jgi:SAM-dependent methyltransferase
VQLGQQALERVQALDHAVSSIREDNIRWELDRDELRVGVVNVELLKGEVRGVADVLEQLGRAIAPAFGLPGAVPALAELRERVTFCERRLRHVETAMTTGDGRPVASAPATAGPPGASAPPGAAEAAAAAAPEVTVPDGRPNAADAGAAPTSTLFDYAGFERRFRGLPEDILAMLDEHYGEILEAHPPVLDLGCGGAELVELLVNRGVAAMGVDTDPSLVAAARARGLDVVQADAVQFLRQQAPGSFGSIVATHLLEHLPLDPLIELLELSQSRLRPGGLFIAETPNPTSLIVLGNAYILDPTHVWPLHPKLLEFLCESAGFRNLEVRFFSPAAAYHMDVIDDPDAPPWIAQVNRAIEQLNNVLFGPQDFAIVAVSGAPDGGASPP